MFAQQLPAKCRTEKQENPTFSVLLFVRELSHKIFNGISIAKNGEKCNF